jgi:hypothetical protein
MLKHNGIEYPDDFSKEQFENFTDVPQEIIDRHFKDLDAKNKRLAAYPDIGEQLDYIYHHGVEKWKSDIIDPIKNKYPTS